MSHQIEVFTPSVASSAHGVRPPTSTSAHERRASVFTRPRPVLFRLVLVVWFVATAGVLGERALAQEPSSAPLAAELATLMMEGQLEAMAGKDSIDADRFVAALAFPGQLLVVSARYEVPIYVEEKIAAGQFRDVYVDLNAASIAGTKVLITDAGANGLRANDDTVDMFDGGSGMLRFDGNPGGQNMSDAQYQSTVADADEQYTRMLRVLIAQARQ